MIFRNLSFCESKCPVCTENLNPDDEVRQGSGVSLRFQVRSDVVVIASIGSQDPAQMCLAKTSKWSTHSRRIDPISLSAKPFCQGEAGAAGLMEFHAPLRRRDEEKSRAKERIYSHRAIDHAWKPMRMNPSSFIGARGRKSKGSRRQGRYRPPASAFAARVTRSTASLLQAPLAQRWSRIRGRQSDRR